MYIVPHQSKRKFQQEHNLAWQLLSDVQKGRVIDKMNELRKELEKRIEDDKPVHYYDERGNLLGDEKFEMQFSLLSVSEEEKQSAREKMKELRLNEVAMEIKHRKMIDALYAEKNALFKRACEERERMKQERMEQEMKAREEEEQKRMEQEMKAREEEKQKRMEQERKAREEEERERMEQEKERMERYQMLVETLWAKHVQRRDDDDIDIVCIPNSTEHTITATIQYINEEEEGTKAEKWEVASFNTYDVACPTYIITGTYNVRNTKKYFRFHPRIANEVNCFMNSECLYRHDLVRNDSDNDSADEYDHY